MQKKKIAYVVSAPDTINAFMTNHIRVVSKEYDVTVIYNGGVDDIDSSLPVMGVIRVNIERKINLLSDVRAMFELYKVFRREKFDIIHSVTPKAGLISSVAGFWSRTPKRYHTFTGQVWVTKSGIFRQFLKALDILIFKLSTGVLVDSGSQKKFLLDNGVVDQSACVIGSGSISGVDLSRFLPSESRSKEVRKELNIPENAFVYLFVGRLSAEKGVVELLAAFKALGCDDVYLLIVGPDEEGLTDTSIKNVLFLGRRSDPEKYMAASNVLCLPSYREGFGTVVIEAAACGVPAIVSDIYGLTDAVVDNETGILVEVKNTGQLMNAMKSIKADEGMYKRLADGSLTRARNEFSQDFVSSELLRFYSA